MFGKIENNIKKLGFKNKCNESVSGDRHNKDNNGLRFRDVIYDANVNSACADVSAAERIEKILSDPRTKKSPARILTLARLYKIFRFRWLFV